VLKVLEVKTSVADPDVYPGSWIRVFASRIPDPESRVDKIPDPGSGSASKNLSNVSPKTATKFSKISPRMFLPDPGSRILVLDFYPSRIQGSKKHRIPGSATLAKSVYP
jgi:hypothetical protein